MADDVSQALPLRVGILTVSDRSAAGQRDDLSGPAIRQIAESKGYEVAIAECIPDNFDQIAQTLKQWADNSICDFILTTGGTGLSVRDVTPEATVSVLERLLPHLAAQIALASVQIIPTSVLSRAVAGIRRQTLIVNLPGSPGGARDGAKIVLEIAKHAIDVLREDGDKAHVQE